MVKTRSGLSFKTVLALYILQCGFTLRKFESETLWGFKNSQLSSVFECLYDTKDKNINQNK